MAAAFGAILAKPLVIAGVKAAGQAIGAISQSNALRAQADARKAQGRQELDLARRQLRRDIGQQAVEAAASGLRTSSFTNVFDSQAIEDAQFLGRIRQQTAFDTQNLRRQATSELIGGAFDVGTSLLAGFGQQQAQKAAVRAAKKATPGARLRPGRNIFGPNRGTVSRGLARKRAGARAIISAAGFI